MHNYSITKRIFRISAAGLFIIFSLSIDNIGRTNSCFVDDSNAGEITVATGWWVKPEVRLLKPSGGETLIPGENFAIQWVAASTDPEATDDIDIDLEYKCGNEPWKEIENNTVNDGLKNWTVPDLKSQDCRVRIAATDAHNLISYRESQKFNIGWTVALNEFMANPPGSDSAKMPNGEWVEIFNNSFTTDVDLSGWYIYDSSNNNGIKIETTNSDNNNNPDDNGETVAPKRGWLVVYINKSYLNNNEDSVKLYSGKINEGGKLVDFINYKNLNVSGDEDSKETKGEKNEKDGDRIETAEGKTWARIPDGVGNWVDPVPTPGKKNKSSNDLEDFQKYYKDICFDDEKPVCEEKFMYSLGLLKEKLIQSDNKKDDNILTAEDVKSIKDNNENVERKEDVEKKKDEADEPKEEGENDEEKNINQQE